MFTATRQILNPETGNLKTVKDLCSISSPFAPLQPPGSAAVLKMAVHIPSMGTWSLISQGTQQILFSKSLVFYFDPSDIKYMTWLHLTQNSLRKKGGYMESDPDNTSPEGKRLQLKPTTDILKHWKEKLGRDILWGEVRHWKLWHIQDNLESQMHAQGRIHAQGRPEKILNPQILISGWCLASVREQEVEAKAELWKA